MTQQERISAPKFPQSERSDDASSEDQSWFWTSEWQEGEKEATKEIQNGELSPELQSMEEIEEHLSSP